MESAFRSAGCVTGIMTAGTTLMKKTVHTPHVLQIQSSNAQTICASVPLGAVMVIWIVLMAQTNRVVQSVPRIHLTVCHVNLGVKTTPHASFSPGFVTETETAQMEVMRARHCAVM
jgi:hypothetical protein